MNMQRYLIAGVVLVLVVLYPMMVSSRSGGAPPGVTGAPNPGGSFEDTCATSCHTNSAGGSGQVVIQSPDIYTPGSPLTITVRVQDPAAAIYGFELTVKDASHAFIGTLANVDATTRTTSGNTNYLTHNGASSTGVWQVRWTPPASATGDIIIYVAGNGANASGTNSGDHIYLANKRISRIPVSVDDVVRAASFTLDSVYPNPFAGEATLGYTLRQAAPVTITLYDAIGREVRQWDRGYQNPGTYQFQLDARALASGVYHYQLKAGEARQSRQLLLVQ